MKSTSVHIFNNWDLNKGWTLFTWTISKKLLALSVSSDCLHPQFSHSLYHDSTSYILKQHNLYCFHDNIICYSVIH